MLDGRYAADAPIDGEIYLLLLPILEKDNRPEAAEERIESGELAEEHPCGKAGGGGEEEESEVRLHKGKIKGNLLSKLIADLVKVVLVKEVLATPLLYPGLVKSMVVQREERLDESPAPVAGSDPRAAIVLRLGEDQVDEARALGLSDGLILQGAGDVLVRAGGADAVEPVLQTGAVDVLGEEVWGGNLDKDEEGGVEPVADFGSEADLGESFDELYEGGLGLGAL